MKSNVVSCRVDDDLFDKINRVSHTLSMTKSKVVKETLEDNLKKFRPIVLSPKEKVMWAKKRYKALDDLGRLSTRASELISLWRYAGNNINQLAKHINRMNKNANDFVTIKKTADLVAQLHEARYDLAMKDYKLVKGVTDLWRTLE